MERAYTVKQIDAMRRDVFTLLLHPGLQSQQAPDDRAVEDRLRTYLVAGVSPEDLKAEATAHQKQLPVGGTFWVEGPTLRPDERGGGGEPIDWGSQRFTGSGRVIGEHATIQLNGGRNVEFKPTFSAGGYEDAD